MKLIRKIRLHWYYWKKVGRYENHLYKEYLYWFDLLKSWWKSLALKRAIRMANARAKAENKRIYVLPDDRNKPRAFNTKEIELLKRHRLMSRKATCVDLFRESIYIADPPKRQKK